MKDSSPNSLLTRAVALTLGLRAPGLGLLPVAAGVALLSWPTAYRTTRQLSRIPRALLMLTVAAAASGWLLRWAIHPSDAVTASDRQALELTMWLFAIPVLVVSAWFCKLRLGIGRTSLLFSVGFVIGNFLYVGSIATANPWKFAYAIPVSLLVLALLGRVSAPRVLVTALLALLAAISFASDYRSTGGLLLLTLGLTAFPVRRAVLVGTPRNLTRGAVGLLLLVGVTYAVLTQAMAGGLLGESAQQRHQIQTRQGTQNLLLGARTEWRVSLEYMREQPLGFGVGMRPSAADRLRAAQIAYGAARNDGTGYYETRALGERVDLHSSLASLWFHFGVPGLGLGLTIAWLLVRQLGARIQMVYGSDPYRPFYLFIGFQALWDLFFSPLAGAFVVVSALGFLMETRRSSGEPGADQSLHETQSDS